MYNIEKIMISFENILSFIHSVLLKINIVLITVWPIIIVTYIVLRAIGITWLFVEEYTLYWLIFISYTLFAYAYREGSHISVEIISEKLPEKIQKIFAVVIDLITLFVSVFLVNKTWNWFSYGFNTKLSSSYPSQTILWPVYFVLVIGMVLLTGEVLIKMYWDLKKLKKETINEHEG